MAAISKSAKRLVVVIKYNQLTLSVARAWGIGFARALNKMMILASVALLAPFTGCSTGATKNVVDHPEYGSDNKPYECDGGICKKGDMQRAYNKGLMTCVNMQNHYELNNNKKSVFTLVISGIGALAGAVFAPLAKGSATKAWAGLAGSTSAFQARLEQEYSNLAFAQIRSAIIGQMVIGEARYGAAKSDNFSGKIDIANEMAMNCRAVPGEAEKQIQQAILEAAKNTNESMANQVDAAKKAAKGSVSSPPAASSVATPAQATTVAPPAKPSPAEPAPP